jgi:curved DNA-binding protein CbpA
VTPPDPYTVLGVSVLADLEQIRSAYRALARSLHPDANPDDATAAARFAEVTEAYELLRDPARRRAYDLSVAVHRGPRPARTAPRPTGNASVRGPSARPAHRPLVPEQEPHPSGRPERDEVAFLGRYFKVLLVLIALFLLAVIIAGMNEAPACGPGANPAFCKPAPSVAP